MKATMLVMHRKEKYSGQNGIEALAVVDEYTLEENPSGWTEEVARVKATIPADEVGAWAEITVELPDAELMTMLYPAMKTFKVSPTVA